MMIGKTDSIDHSEASEDHSESSITSAPIIRQRTVEEWSTTSGKDEDDNISDKSSFSLNTTCTISSKLNPSVAVLPEQMSTQKVAVSVHDERKKEGQISSSLQGTPTTALLSATSTTSLSSISSSAFRGTGRYRRVGVVDADDLSTPYNHYRCLSPNEHYGRLKINLIKAF